MIIYKIRHKDKQDKFLSGTPTYHSWHKDGRVFPTLGKLRTFLTNSIKYNRLSSDWEVVEFELTELSIKGVHEMIKPEQLIKVLTR